MSLTLHRPPPRGKSDPPDFGEPIASTIIALNETAALKIELVAIQGRLCISQRRLWRRDPEDAWKPTKKGYAVGCRHARALADALVAMAAKVDEIAGADR